MTNLQKRCRTWIIIILIPTVTFVVFLARSSVFIQHTINTHEEVLSIKDIDIIRNQTLVPTREPQHIPIPHSPSNKSRHESSVDQLDNQYGRQWRPSWQTVVRNYIYVYSAFYKAHKHSVIVIALMDDAALSMHDLGKLTCNITMATGDHVVTPVKYSSLAESNSKRFSAAMITCKLPTSSKSQQITSVSLLVTGSKRLRGATNTLPVHHPSHTAPPPTAPPPQHPAPPGAGGSPNTRYEFVVCCSSPVHGNYSDTQRLIEWVELNSMFGGDLFVLYNQNAGPALHSVLRHYVISGRAHVWSWDYARVLPAGADVGYYAQMAAINDCLLRYGTVAENIVYVDLDEFIVPVNTTSWREMMDTGRQAGQCPKSPSHYIVRNVFFDSKADDDEEASQNITVRNTPLVTQLKTKRLSRVWPAKERSKYILSQPNNVPTAGVHYVAAWLSVIVTECVLPPDVGLLHHYRRLPPGVQDNDVISDRRMLRFRDELVERVAAVHNIVNS